MLSKKQYEVKVRNGKSWGGKLWTQSYFVETIGNANEEVIRAYVQSQLKEHKKKEKIPQQLDLF